MADREIKDLEKVAEEAKKVALFLILIPSPVPLCLSNTSIVFGGPLGSARNKVGEGLWFQVEEDKMA